MFTSVKKYYKLLTVAAGCAVLLSAFVLAKKQYSNPDFGKTFGTKAATAQQKLQTMNNSFELCGSICRSSKLFMQSIVFPEVMRFNELKDDIETESLRTLYVQFGKDYADFSVGLFQMKPSFAELLELNAKRLLTDSMYHELQLNYQSSDAATIRSERIKRLQDADWQLIYLTAFICVCNELYKHKTFNNETEKMQWYAAVYNSGFDKADRYITKKITEENFYLQQGMPGKKFRYAAVAKWFYLTNF
ncbi:MAG: hypothetical protein K2X48_12620 [Chitinophagaceae bacterium]|nr:hypothetical protein [Chitinophagaceae bacterium]